VSLANTEYDREPLSWAAEKGHEVMVKMLIKQKDPCTAVTENKNQPLKPSALSKEHDAVVSIQR